MLPSASRTYPSHLKQYLTSTTKDQPTFTPTSKPRFKRKSKRTQRRCTNANQLQLPLIQSFKGKTMNSFSYILDKPATEIDRPKPLPVGTYTWSIQGLPKHDKSREKQTPYVEFT